jgi:transcriptional regulator with XRE-family HTH domain
MDNKLVGQNIRKYRRFRDMSQKELAKEVGYATKSSINKIEAGDASVPIPRLTQIANALRVPLQALMENIPDDGMPYEDYSTTEVASTNQSNELEFVVQNRIEYMEIGELKNHIDSEMDKMAQSYKFLATFVEKAEAEIKALKKQEIQNGEFVKKYNQLTAENRAVLKAMIETMLQAQKNTAQTGGEGTQKGTPSLQQVPSREKETNKPCE